MKGHADDQSRIHVAPEVAAVLADATVQDGAVKLPDELAQPVYVAVNKALVAIGGRCDRRRAGHVFPAGVNPADRLGTGKATSARAAGFFETPPQPVAELVAVAQILPEHRVLEPSAGHGAIPVRLLELVGADNLTVVELLDEHCRVLRDRGLNPIQAGFLTADLDGPFDRIVMNPPFDQRQDVRHVAHAFSLLAPGGRLVAVMAEGVTYRDDRATDIGTVTVLLDKPATAFAGSDSTACAAVGAGATHTHHHED
jgi:predicted RNA methylase